jgi:hypothetical protein
VLGVVGEVGERGLVDVEHPHLLPFAGELQALGVGDGLVDDGAGVAPVVAAHHVVADVPLAAGRDGAPVAQGVGLHGEPPAVARHAGAQAQAAAGAQQRAEHVDQRHAVVDDHLGGGRHLEPQLPRAGAAAGRQQGREGGEEGGEELGRCHRRCVGDSARSSIRSPFAVSVADGISSLNSLAPAPPPAASRAARAARKAARSLADAIDAVWVIVLGLQFDRLLRSLCVHLRAGRPAVK